MNLELRANEKHLCFTLSTPEDQARLEFFRRYGQEPRETFVFARMLWVGPVPAEFIRNAPPAKPAKPKPEKQENQPEQIALF